MPNRSQHRSVTQVMCPLYTVCTPYIRCSPPGSSTPYAVFRTARENQCGTRTGPVRPVDKATCENSKSYLRLCRPWNISRFVELLESALTSWQEAKVRA